jgi:hypothetical protein
VVCSGFSSSSVVIAALAAAAVPAVGQSSHLARLELATPAITPDPVSGVAVGGWASAWLAPATGGQAGGILVGIEHSGFASVTTTFALARVRLGPTWQFSWAQTRVANLFDELLLSDYPELGALAAAATQLGIDAVFALKLGAAIGVGARYERDEFLGEAGSAWLARISVDGPVVLGVHSALSYERILDDGSGGAAVGHLRAGLAHHMGGKRLAATVALGASVGDLWRLGSNQRRLGASLRLALLDVVSLTGAVGAEHDLYAGSGWLRFAALGAGLTFGSLSAHLRRGGAGTAEAAATAVSVVFGADADRR